MQMRLHKFMSQVGVASRRHSEELIRQGSVMVNGQVAVIGQVIDPAVDQVKVGRKILTAIDTHQYFLLNKPKGVVSTASDPEGRPTVLSLVPVKSRLYPVGRLDFDSEGLIILTDDGDFAHHLTHPKFEIDKTYRVLIRGLLSPQNRGRLEHGLNLSDGVTAPTTISEQKPEGGLMWLTITLHEGRNRQIRRMFEAVGHTVLRLIRIKFGPYELGELSPGEYRKLDPELSMLK